jgi:hypothetical protein
VTALLISSRVNQIAVVTCLSNLGNLLCDFVLSRISGDTEGIGASAKALLALEERGQWDQTRAAEIMTT